MNCFRDKIKVKSNIPNLFVMKPLSAVVLLSSNNKNGDNEQELPNLL